MSTSVPKRLVCLLVALVASASCGSKSAVRSIPDDGSPDLCADGTEPCARVVRLGTQWHTDPDGDGVQTETDLCPAVYDLAQTDIDADGIGDFCDPDFVKVPEAGVVVDLRAENVTPYGAWFTFTSPATTRYGRDYLLAWSTKRADLESKAAFLKLKSANKYRFRVYEYFGLRTLQPQIITSMSPDTHYFVTVRAEEESGQPSTRTGNIVEIETAPAPVLSPAGSHPRAWARAAQLQALKERNKRGDKAWVKWSGVMGPRVLYEAKSEAADDFGLCLSAALLFHGTGQVKYKEAALGLIETMRKHWEKNELGDNQLRWLDSNLAICADLMWNELSTAQHDRIVAAYLADDEVANIDRLIDTDHVASVVRTWIIDGLVACGATELSAELADRACQLLDRGLRGFYGVQLVKTRRDSGFFAMSGGGMPDGMGYGVATASYWLHTLHALGNVSDLDMYAPWVWHNLMSMEVQPLTPTRRGFATFGDLDSYDNFALEPNSLPVPQYARGLVAMHMGLLERAGMTVQAGHARAHLNMFPANDSSSGWAMLLFDNERLAERADGEGLPTSYFDSGMGMFFDRTGWRSIDSMFTFRAGWSGVDHNHEDAGSVQFYRKGVWITHEALGYNGPASEAGGHNVPALEIGFDERGKRVGQYALEPAKSARTYRAGSTPEYAFVASDLTGAYTSSRYQSFAYEAVERHVLWLKGSKAGTDDRLIIYDRIDSKTKTPSRRGWQMHIDAIPAISGSRATFVAGSHVQVDVVVPATTTLRYEKPEGVHSQYPGKVYTGRLVADAQSTDRQLRYVSVLRASDVAIDRAAQGVESNDVVGVLSGTDLVLFPRGTPARVGDSQSVSLQASDSISIWWTGLEPETGYEMLTSKSNGMLTITLSKGGKVVADEAGVWRGRFDR